MVAHKAEGWEQRAQRLSRACGGVVRDEEGVWKMAAISFADHRHGRFSKSMEGTKKAGNLPRPSDHLTAIPGTSEGSAGR